MTHEEAMNRAKALREQLYQAIVSGKVHSENTWLNLVADALYSVALPEEQRCPRPINTATNESKAWCQQNGHCGCEDVSALRKCYGERVYPLEINHESTLR